MSESKKKRQFWYWVNIPLSLFTPLVFFGYEILLLKNISLLLVCLFVFGTPYLLSSLVRRCFVPPPEPKTWRAWKELFSYFGVCTIFGGITLYVMWRYVPPVAISEKTTYLTEPRTADGMEVDIIAAIENRFAPKGRPEDNGFRKVVEQFGLEALYLPPNYRDGYIAQLERQLGLKIPENPLVKFQSTGWYFSNQLRETEDYQGDLSKDIQKIEARLRCKPWTEDDIIEDIKGSEIWLAENTEAMNRFGEAVRMPYYYVPIFIPSGSRLLVKRFHPEEDFHRGMTLALHFRIMNSLAKGDLDQAFYDVETLLRFAEAQVRYANSTSQISYACNKQRIAMQAVFQLIKYGHLTREQLRELDRLFQKYQAVISISDMVFLTRMEGMGVLYESVPIGLLFEDNEMEWYLQYFLSVNKYFPWNEVFAHYQETLNQLERIAEQPISRNQFNELTQWEYVSDFFKRAEKNSITHQCFFYSFRKGSYTLVPHAVGEILLSSSRMFLWPTYSSITSTRQAEIAIALELYRWDYGEYPETLEALRGVYLDEIPDDPYTDGEPFRYVLKEHNGVPGYTLYSVGPDGEDDGGKNSSSCACGGCDCGEETSDDQPPPKRTDDIAIKMGGRW